MNIEISDELMQEILKLDSQFDGNAPDECFERSAEIIGILAEKIGEQLK